MFVTDNITVIKTAIAAGGMTGSWGIFAVADQLGSLPMQLTALGFFGGSVIYVVVKIIPAAMKQRQDESAAFLKAIQTMTDDHSKEVAELRRIGDETAAIIRKDSTEERLEWLRQMDRNTKVLTQIAEAVRDCPAKRG